MVGDDVQEGNDFGGLKCYSLIEVGMVTLSLLSSIRRERLSCCTVQHLVRDGAVVPLKLQVVTTF